MLRLALACLIGFSLPASAGEVTVFAAASLKNALDQVAADWQATSGNTVVLTYGGSPAIAKQIMQGAPADLFVSASKQWMDEVENAGLTVAGTREDLLSNHMVLVGQPGAAPVELTASTDLAGLLAGGKLSMALVDSVPAGQYGKASLETLGLWQSVEPSVVQSENVRAALALVATKEAALGIVYASDAVAEPGVAVIGTFPDDSHPKILYPAAEIAPGKPEAQDFLTYLHSDAARAVFEQQGFVVLPPNG